MSCTSYSRSSRSWTISMWSSPRKPHRKPNPSATEFSGSAVKEESFSRSLSIAVRSWGYWSEASG